MTMSVDKESAGGKAQANRNAEDDVDLTATP